MSVDTLQRKLDALEAEYSASLIVALERCAAGHWGLFGQNAGLTKHPATETPEIDDLLELGSEIEKLRRQLGYSDAFALHARLCQMRAAKHPNALGEPKLARQWLDEMHDASR